MKLILLSEATMDDIRNRIPALLAKYFRNEPEEKSIDTLRQIAEIDPTRGKYVEWLARQLKAGRIRLPEDAEKTKDNLTRFDRVKNRLEIRDINRYTPAKLYDAIQPFETQEKLRGKADPSLLALPPGSELIIDNPPYQIVKITEVEAATSLSKGTNWCTKGEDAAGDYLDFAPLYLVYKNRKKYLLVCIVEDWALELKLTNDEEITGPERFKIIDLLEPETGQNKTTNGRMAVEYAKQIIGGRWPPGEEAILSTIGQLYDDEPPPWVEYVRDVIEGSWPEAEERISELKKERYPGAASNYARAIEWVKWRRASN